MRSLGRAELLLFSALFLAPRSAQAQGAETLPEAPTLVTPVPNPGDLPSAYAGRANQAYPEPPLPPYPPARHWEGEITSPWIAQIAGAEAPSSSAAAPGVRIDLDDLVARMDRPASPSLPSAFDPSEASPEHYHWKGLLWESFAFFGVENTQRLLADPFFRRITADKPYWHDYFASVKQWNWHRWYDGDDFLVAYIAHPMQGAVTEFIEIQNSPAQRGLRIIDGTAYWHSRLLAFAWAAAFSFDQKLGPLGETALGSEGGYTYLANCAFPCRTFSPDQVTNNTGWVKLVSTPVVGTLWTVVEDFLDHFVSDRVQGDDDTRKFPKILRGSLNPTRTMANFLRWRKPWYRDFQQDAADVHITRRPHFLPGEDEFILSAPEFDFFPHYYAISLPVNTSACTRCRRTVNGFGFAFARRIATYADLDSDISFLPNASPAPSDRAGGSILNGTFGLRSGYTNRNFSLKAFLRPGFLSYDRAYQASPTAANPSPPIGRITHFTTALGVEGDRPVNRHLAIRGVLGNQPVRYREPYVDPPGPGKYPYYDWLSKQYFLTNENWMVQAGAVLRF